MRKEGGADLVFDVLGPVGVFHGVQCLHKVTVAGRDTGDHKGPTGRRLREQGEETDLLPPRESWRRRVSFESR